MARRAGVRAAIAVLGPFPTEKRLRAAKPDLLLDSIEELPGPWRVFKANANLKAHRQGNDQAFAPLASGTATGWLSVSFLRNPSAKNTSTIAANAAGTIQ